MKILTEDCVIYNGSCYFFSSLWNGLYKYNLKTGKLQALGIMPGEDLFAERLTAGITICQDVLYIAPMKARKIWSYNLKNNQWLSIERNQELLTNSNEMFTPLLHNDRIFFVGSNYPGIVIYDVNNNKSITFSEPYKFLEGKRKSDEIFFRCDYVLLNNDIYLASCLDNHVLIIDSKNNSYRWVAVGDPSNKYRGIAWDGKNFWLAPNGNDVLVEWDGGVRIKNHDLKLLLKSGEYYNFTGAVFDGKNIVFPGTIESGTVKLNINKGRSIEKEKRVYRFYKNKDGWIVRQLKNGLIICSLIKNPDVKYTFLPEYQSDYTNIEQHLIRKSTELGSVINENDYLSISDFAKGIAGDKKGS